MKTAVCAPGRSAERHINRNPDALGAHLVSRVPAWLAVLRFNQSICSPSVLSPISIVRRTLRGFRPSHYRMSRAARSRQVNSKEVRLSGHNDCTRGDRTCCKPAEH